MTFAEYCSKNNDGIYRHILNYLPDREPKEHYAIARDYTERRGKYARPNLALLWCELFGGDKENVFPYAAGIQMAEDWFLMQDDWMDQNEVRRGKPTAHLLYGAASTINASNSVQTAMWRMVYDNKPQTHPRPPLSGRDTTRLFDKFYDIINVTIEGQFLDLKLTERKITDFTLDDYWQSIHAKAAYYSVYGPMQLGVIAAGQPENVVEKIAEYGEKIGRAFQLKDDILDCTSNEETLGKTIGNDILEGTKTAILWFCLQKSTPPELEELQSIYAKNRKEKTPAEISYVLNLFKKTGAIASAEKLTDDLAKEASKEFEKQMENITQSPLKETARDAIKALTARIR